MSTRDVLLRAAGRKLIDVDGEGELVSLQPPASPARVAEIEGELGFALPRELTELLSLSAGLDMEVQESLDLASIEPCPWEGPLGQVMNLVGDGAGNYWVVELHPGMEILGPVWFVCHDAPVLVYQSPDLAAFVDDYLRFCAAPHDGPVASVVREAVQRVWTQRDLPSSDLLDSQDPVLRDFARRLGDGWFIRDLRHAKPGDGMPIGRFGPKTPLARAGQEFVFAYGSRTRMERFKTWLTGR